MPDQTIDLPMGINPSAAQPGATEEELEPGEPGEPREPREPGSETAWLAALIAAEARAVARLGAEEMLGRGLLRLRLHIGWSQRDLEGRSGVDQSTICRLETGRAANVGSARL